MKKFYASFLSLMLLALPWCQHAQAQCANGFPGGGTAFDTTVAFGVGVTNKQIKFPKFDATTGMLTCVKLVVTLVGVVNYVGMQNLAASTNQADFYYNRGDNMTGPGLTPALTNSFNGHYGPYNLTPYDGVAGAGSDFQSISNDTILRQSMSRTLTDSTTISQFYGPPGDSLVYDYNMSLFTYAAFTADNSSSVSTSALVNFRFEYCTCPLSVLPLGLKNFSVTKNSNTTAGLRWEAEAGSDNYYYEIEVSRDGKTFSKVTTMNKQTAMASPVYQCGYAVKPNDYGRYYFRVKQQWLDGYYRYSDVRSADFSNPLFSSVSVYPNPSTGTVGLKFVAAKAGLYSVKISNAAGQLVADKDVQVAETDFKQLAALRSGTYYVKITELATGAACVQRLVVQ